ncbi:MAG TPA: winged helix-turn-helix domain-containing protein [Gemmatimonadaceae bacterium]
MTKRRATPRKSATRSTRPVGAPPLDARVADLRALAHPLRLRMIELFAEMPRTTKQVAELLGEPPTRLYHHVAALERAGFLVLKATKANRGATEKWYEAVAPRIATGSAEGDGATAVVLTSSSRDSRGAKRALVTTLLDQTRREVFAAATSTDAQPILLARLVVAIPSSSVPEVRRHLQEALVNIRHDLGIEDQPPDAECERWAMTLAFTPVWPNLPRTKKAAE